MLGEHHVTPDLALAVLAAVAFVLRPSAADYRRRHYDALGKGIGDRRLEE